MTISITPEELKAHEANCKAWAGRRAAVLETELKTSYASSVAWGGPTSRDRENFNRILQVWESENPFPKLLPAV